MPGMKAQSAMEPAATEGSSGLSRHGNPGAASDFWVAFWIMGIGAIIATPALAGDGSGTVATLRNMGKEASDMAKCLSGPDALPAPPGVMTPQDCLDLFDYNDDFDVDLDDYQVYLHTLPFDAPPEVELGYAYGQPYETLNDGDMLPAHTSGQGGTHAFIYVRGFGFPPDCEVNIDRSSIIVSTGEPVGPDMVFWSILPNHGVGVDQLMDLFFLEAFPVGQADGEELILTYTVQMVQAPFLTATVTRRVILNEGGQ